MSGKKKGKQSKGYVPGDARGNFLRASCGIPVVKPDSIYTVNPDRLRQFLLMRCFDSRLKVQVNVYTCRQLANMANEAFGWPVEGDDDANAQRKIKRVCDGQGIQTKKATLGRPRGSKNKVSH